MRRIKTALISVFNKEGIEDIVKKLDSLEVRIYSTGGTEDYIRGLGVGVEKVEDLTLYPSILGGRVKTLHPKVFGGILSRRDNERDTETLNEYKIPEIDLVIVDLYPFEKTVRETSDESEIIEKIDIGGISLIRAAAKNYKDVVVLPSVEYYQEFLNMMTETGGILNLEQRKYFATRAFEISSNYDFSIYNYFSNKSNSVLRYGENPHQTGIFEGNIDELFIKYNGKDLSYNNFLDIDAGINLMREFKDPTFVIIKHNNACGVASRDNIYEAYLTALECDPVSAFGGILVANREIDKKTASEIDKLFCEVIISPKYSPEALEILKSKPNRIILEQKKELSLDKKVVRSCLNGVLVQDNDFITYQENKLKLVTKKEVSAREKEDLIFATKVCKHTKSNAVVLAKNRRLISSGMGQTSRIDSLKQAIDKAIKFKLDIRGSVLASDAFFPFPDVVEMSAENGIVSIIQPGGSIKDNLSIDKCDERGISMLFTGFRHFKH